MRLLNFIVPVFFAIQFGLILAAVVFAMLFADRQGTHGI